MRYKYLMSDVDSSTVQRLDREASILRNWRNTVDFQGASF
jgi:hypothetical protein